MDYNLVMPYIYKKYCNICGTYYEKQNKYFCSKKCTPVSIGFLKSNRFKGRKHTLESIEKKRLSQLGKNGSNWQGGISRCNVNNFKSNKASRRQAIQYVKNRKIIDVNFRLMCNLRARLNTAIKRGYKAGSAIRDLGCTINELKIYLENQFKEGMTWNNYGLFGWHIDHKKPLSLFDLTNRKQFLEACNYINLQPLWCDENIKKHNRVIV